MTHQVEQFSRPKQNHFEYQQRNNETYDPVDMDQSYTSISSVFIAPSKGAKQNMDRLVKIKEKILNPGSDMSHDIDFSSTSKFSRSINGTNVMKDSIASLSMDQGSDEEEEDHKVISKNPSREIHYNESHEMLKNYSHPSIRNKGTVSRERFEYYPAREEVYEPKDDSMSVTKQGIQNMAISDHLKAVIEENKRNVQAEQDMQNYVNSNNIDAQNDLNDPNKNMINLENILIIEKKISEILEGINTMVEINLLCEDWWEVTQEETMLMNLGNVFKEPKYKAILKQATL